MLQINVMLINDTSQWPLFVQWWHTHWNYYYNVLKNNVEFNFKIIILMN